MRRHPLLSSSLLVGTLCSLAGSAAAQSAPFELADLHLQPVFSTTAVKRVPVAQLTEDLRLDGLAISSTGATFLYGPGGYDASTALAGALDACLAAGEGFTAPDAMFATNTNGLFHYFRNANTSTHDIVPLESGVWNNVVQVRAGAWDDLASQGGGIDVIGLPAGVTDSLLLKSDALASGATTTLLIGAGEVVKELEVVDLLDDGDLEIAVWSDYASQSRILVLDHGGGTPVNVYQRAFIPDAVKLFPLEYGSGANRIGILMQHPSGVWLLASAWVGGQDFRANLGAVGAVDAASGDLDGDGAPDVVVSAKDPITGAARLLVFINNNGSPTSQTFNNSPEYTLVLDGAAGLTGDVTPGEPTLADLDNDGDLDILVPVADSSGYYVAVLPGTRFSRKSAAPKVLTCDDVDCETQTPTTYDYDVNGNLILHLEVEQGIQELSGVNALEVVVWQHPNWLLWGFPDFTGEAIQAGFVTDNIGTGWSDTSFTIAGIDYVPASETLITVEIREVVLESGTEDVLAAGPSVGWVFFYENHDADVQNACEVLHANPQPTPVPSVGNGGNVGINVYPLSYVPPIMTGTYVKDHPPGVGL